MGAVVEVPSEAVAAAINASIRALATDGDEGRAARAWARRAAAEAIVRRYRILDRRAEQLCGVPKGCLGYARRAPRVDFARALAAAEQAIAS